MIEEMKRIIEQTKGIRGLMTHDELALLCRFARSASSIAELGCYQGRSLIAMGLTNPDAQLYGIDWFGDMSYRGYEGSTFEKTRFNLTSRGVKAEIYVGRTDEIAPKFDHEIDLLHIDAGHSYEECLNDLNNYTPKIRPGGAVCIHDYGTAQKKELERPEVMDAVNDWAEANPDWVEVERAGTMIAFRHMIAPEGVLYVAYGEKAVENVENSIRSLRERLRERDCLLTGRSADASIATTEEKQMTGDGGRGTGKTELPIAVITGRPPMGSDAPTGVDHIIYHLDMDPGARNVKTRIYSLSPFYKTLYLDADTEVWDDPQHGFDLLDKVDLVMGQDTVKIFNRNHHPHMVKEETIQTRKETGGGEYAYYNTGVMFFTRNERVKALMQSWHQEWTRWCRQDQPAMFRAMFKKPVRIAAMRKPWNTHHSRDAKFVFHAHRRASRTGAPK